MATNSLRELHLNEQELGATLRHAGVAPQTGSPLGPVRANGSADPVVLRQHGVLDVAGRVDTDWHMALSALAAPRSYFGVYVGTGTPQPARMFVPIETGFVGHVLAEGTHTLAMPYTPDTLVVDLLTLLSAASVRDVRAFTESLWLHELAALVALADLYREEALRAMLDRRQPDFGRASFEQLEYELRQGLNSEDVRWLASVLRMHSPDGFELRLEHLRAGLAGFAQRQWLRLDENGIALSPALQNACFALDNTTPYLVISSRTAEGFVRNALLVRSTMAIISFEFLWTETRQPFVRVGAADAALARDLLLTYVAPLAVGLPPVGTTRRQAPVPVQAPAVQAMPSPVHSATATRSYPAPAPAAPAAAPRNVCRNPSCGREIVPGRKFCPSCGTPAA